MYAHELLAFEAARSRRALRDDQHQALAREPAMYVRREWARRVDIPAHVAQQECAENRDIVVRTRLCPLPDVSWDAALRHLGADGYIAPASVAMRKDCPDDLALSLLRSLPVKKQIHLWHSVRLAAERSLTLGDRPHAAKYLLDVWMDALPVTDLPELLCVLSDLYARERILDRVEARVRWCLERDERLIRIDRYGDDAEMWLLDFLHRVPQWVSSALRGRIPTLPGVQECELVFWDEARDRPPMSVPVEVWTSRPALRHSLGNMAILTSMYNTDQGIVFSRLLDTSRLSLGEVVQAAHRLAPHPSMDEFLQQASKAPR
jgi:hypothetical protein